MSSRQEKIHEFPEDDAFWFIKWIDEFRIPHLGTRSASVSVVLQKLPITKISDFSALTAEGLLQILGQRKKKDQSAEALPVNPRITPGTLPLLYIGAVFCNKVRVGELPTRRRRLELLNGGQEGKEITLGEAVPAPLGWPKKVPHILLNKYEYSIAPYKMPRSRCLVIERQNITYVIPRMTIFKTFYACHTELAKTFCSGPWPDRLKDVICLSELKSGLKTEVNSSGQWNIILQTLVPDKFAELLALYYFDPFAKACAESIYSKSLQDRGGRVQATWYASAQIPFKSTKETLRLDIRGFQLRSWKYKVNEEASIENQKFLVTEIVGSTWPEYIPAIGYERFNSGETGGTQTRAEGSKPYNRTSEGQPSDQDTEIDGEHDAHAGSQTTHMDSTEFGWLNPPRKKKLKKESSQRYTSSDGPLPLSPGSKVSTGEHTHQQDTKAKGEAEVVIRLPEKRFDHLLEVFKSLVDKKFISSIQLLPCPVPGKQIRRGSLECWSFIDEKSLKHAYSPRRGWRLAEYDSKNSKNCKYRSALVVMLGINGKYHYWIEIECRGSEGGYRSPLLSNVNGSTTEIITTALEIIADKKGMNLKTPLNDKLGEHGVITRCYKHVYVSSKSAKLDINSVRRFLSDANRY